MNQYTKFRKMRSYFLFLLSEYDESVLESNNELHPYHVLLKNMWKNRDRSETSENELVDKILTHIIEHSNDGDENKWINMFFEHYHRFVIKPLNSVPAQVFYKQVIDEHLNDATNELIRQEINNKIHELACENQRELFDLIIEHLEIEDYSYQERMDKIAQDYHSLINDLLNHINMHNVHKLNIALNELNIHNEYKYEGSSC